jgi:hypothetical protein
VAEAGGPLGGGPGNGDEQGIAMGAEKKGNRSHSFPPRSSWGSDLLILLIYKEIGLIFGDYFALEALFCHKK